MRHILSILVENEAGALSRISGLFSARGYNIESLTVAPTEDTTMSRMTIVTVGSDDVIEQISRHKGEPDFSWIPQVKQAVSIPIFVNGGLDTPERIRQTFEETGCDGVMIGQAAINNPWLFRQARYYMEHKELLPAPDLDERVRVLLEHLRLSVLQKGETRAVLEFRKHYTGYLRDLPNVSKIRSELMHFTEMSPIVDHIQKYVAWLKSAEPLTIA